MTGDSGDSERGGGSEGGESRGDSEGGEGGKGGEGGESREENDIGEEGGDGDRRWARTALGLGLVAVAFVAVGLTLRTGGDHGDRTTETTLPPVALPSGWRMAPDTAGPVPLLEETPLWDAGHAGLPKLADAAALEGDAVVLVPLDTDDALVVVDVAERERRWGVSRITQLPDGSFPHVTLDDPTLPSGGAIPLVDLPDGGWAVLVDYSLYRPDGQAETGVVALSGADGHVVWRRPLVSVATRDFDADTERVKALRSDGRTVLAVVGGRHHDPDDVGNLRTVALDGATGATLWQQDGINPRAMLGEVTVADVGTPGGVPIPAVVDTATGRRRPDALARYPRSRLRLAAGHVVVLSLPEQGRTPEQLVFADVTSGRELGQFAADTDQPCAADAALIACPVLGREEGRTFLATIGTDGTGRMVSSQALHDRIEGVWRGAVVTEPGLPPSTVTLLGRDARRVGEVPAGPPLVDDGELVIVRDVSTNPHAGYAVYRVGA